jgi:hypothetical protein
MTTQELVDKYGRAQLGVDGDCGFALLGSDIMEGEVEFVKIVGDQWTASTQRAACKKALTALRDRLGLPELSYYLGDSYPGNPGCRC